MSRAPVPFGRYGSYPYPSRRKMYCTSYHPFCSAYFSEETSAGAYQYPSPGANGVLTDDLHVVVLPAASIFQAGGHFRAFVFAVQAYARIPQAAATASFLPCQSQHFPPFLNVGAVSCMRSRMPCRCARSGQFLTVCQRTGGEAVQENMRVIRSGCRGLVRLHAVIRGGKASSSCFDFLMRQSAVQRLLIVNPDIFGSVRSLPCSPHLACSQIAMLQLCP